MAKFFYNCEGENAYGLQDIKELCRFYQATENVYNDFFKITDVTGIRSEGYIINFPFYIQAERDAHVLLTAKPVADRAANEYEIREYKLLHRIKTKIMFQLDFFLFNISSHWWMGKYSRDYSKKTRRQCSS